ncbi:hypothetical protein [Nocardioides ochotonae]|uniref:hypothetical protein n=1 Tax=Nocardioides ochotonae TaxID=2685869 RepID=UPI0014087FCC|nr:hypothetical protein [Nocardioides ochotonae]
MSTHSTHLGHPLDERVLDAETARTTLRSMASVTRVILGVALQAPAEPETLSAAPAAAPPHAPVALAQPSEPEPLQLAVEPDPEPAPAAYAAPAEDDADWMPALAAVPRLAVVDPLPPAPERHNVGLLAELAFLDD